MTGSAGASRRWRERNLAQIIGRPKPETCEVCGRAGVICMDHCHAAGTARGWLCQGCNLALGHAADDPAVLRKLADYLEHIAK